MVLNTKNKFQWTLIIIVDPECLPGRSIFNVIVALQKVAKYRFIMIDDIVGAKISALLEKQNMVLKLEDLLMTIYDVVQFDWGNFFLFKEYPDILVNSESMKNPEIIVQTDSTVRAVDDGYIYIYTHNQEVIDVIKNSYKIESMKTDWLENLEYPY